MLSDLAFALADGGERVTVITSRQRYDAPLERLPTREAVGGVDVHRVWTSRFGRFNLAGRTIDYVTFYFSAAWRLWRTARRGDIVIAKTDPPMLSVIAAPVCWLRGAKLVNWLQDVFPEVADALGVGHGPVSRLGYRLLRSLRDASLRGSSGIVAIGDLMARRFAGDGRGLRVAVIHNWADGALIRPVAATDNASRRAWGLADRFVVGYSGNLGRAHAYDTLLAAIAAIEAQAGVAQGGPHVISWLFIGGGAQFDAFRDAVRKRGFTSVVFQPYQPREALAQSLSAADVHLVSLRPELEGLIVPSKFYGVAAAGRPTVFIGDPSGEIASILEHHGCGLTVRQGDGDALAQAVLKLANDRSLCAQMGQRAREALEANFDKSVAIARWRALLAAIDAGVPISQALPSDGVPAMAAIERVSPQRGA